MTPGNNDRRKKIIGFSLILLAAAVLTTVLIAAFWGKDEGASISKTVKAGSPNTPSTADNELLAGNRLLSSRLNSLLLLDKQYADALTASGDKKSLDSISLRIDAEDRYFRASVDSIFINSPMQTDSGSIMLFNNIVSSYRSISDSRTSISSLRNAVDLHSQGLKPDEMAMLKIQNELQEKNNRIESLETALKDVHPNNANKVQQPADEKGENTKPLKETIAAQESKIANLTAVYYSLKQDNEKLLKQQNDASKTSASGELSIKNKTAGLQQKIEELNAELRLAQVDCNLSRVDAEHIISNSRQRKELLSEASGILSSLAQSDDADIRKKVQDKIVRLNKVAANSRD